MGKGAAMRQPPSLCGGQRAAGLPVWAKGQQPQGSNKRIVSDVTPGPLRLTTKIRWAGGQYSRRIGLVSTHCMALYQFWGAVMDQGQPLEHLGLDFMGWRTHRHGVLTWVPSEKLAGVVSQELKLVPHFPSSLGRGTSIVTLGTLQWFHRR